MNSEEKSSSETRFLDNLRNEKFTVKQSNEETNEVASDKVYG